MKHDAIIIGAGPNGLAAAIELARAGRSVVVFERSATVGGSARSAALTLDGFVHDHCATVAALATSSPFLKMLPLADFGCEFVQPPVPFAHPFDDGTAAVLHRSMEETAATLGVDGDAWIRLLHPFVERWGELAPTLLAPPLWPPSWTKTPLLTARFGLHAIGSARTLVDRQFKGPAAKALFGGAAAHAIVPLTWRGTAAFGLVLACNAHADGWPVVRGGMQKLSNAMADYFRSLGGTIVLDHPVDRLDSLPPAKVVLCDVGPRQFIQMAGDSLPANSRKRLAKFRYGPGVFKLDWALSEPIPWRSIACRSAGTVHLGGTFEELQASEAAPWRGEHSAKPYVLLVQASLFDPTRAPAGMHTAWAYCHVPSGSTADQTEAIEAQIERFAPGFRDVILARHSINAVDMENFNPNLVGGDITGGAQTLKQTLFRPVAALGPYRTGRPHTFLCSSSTPPGGGIHGMCGFHAARAAINDIDCLS